MTLGTAITAASCGPLIQPTAGMPMDPPDSVMAADSNSCRPDRLLEGDVVKTLPDTATLDSLFELERLEGEPPVPLDDPSVVIEDPEKK